MAEERMAEGHAGLTLGSAAGEERPSIPPSSFMRRDNLYCSCCLVLLTSLRAARTLSHGAPAHATRPPRVAPYVYSV